MVTIATGGMEIMLVVRDERGDGKRYSGCSEGWLR